MENLEERKVDIQDMIDDLSNQILMLEKELEEIEEIMEQDVLPLNVLINDLNKFLNIEKVIETYEHTLGGDGRSAPWSELRQRFVVHVTTKMDIYVTQKQQELLTPKIKNTMKVDKVVFK